MLNRQSHGSWLFLWDSLWPAPRCCNWPSPIPICIVFKQSIKTESMLVRTIYYWAHNRSQPLRLSGTCSRTNFVHVWFRRRLGARDHLKACANIWRTPRRSGAKLYLESGSQSCWGWAGRRGRTGIQSPKLESGTCPVVSCGWANDSGRWFGIDT